MLKSGSPTAAVVDAQTVDNPDPIRFKYLHHNVLKKVYAIPLLYFIDIKFKSLRHECVKEIMLFLCHIVRIFIISHK